MTPRSVAALAAVMLPALVWLYGWRTIDTVEWRALTAAPFAVSLDPSQQFLYGSPLTFLLGSYYIHQGLDFAAAFAVVHGLGLIFFAGALFRCLTTLCSTDGRAAGAIVLAGSPLLFVILTWIGKSDTYLLAFYLLLLSTRSPVMQALLAVLMIASHRELALAMLFAHVLLRGQARPIGAGVAAGLAGSLGFIYVLLDAVPASRIDFMLANATSLATRVMRHPFTYLIAALGPFWLYLFRPSALSTARIVVLAMAAVLASLTLDFTRVFVLASAPLLLLLTEEVVDELRTSGGMLFWGHRIGLGALTWLAFAQIQVAGAKVFWVRGLEWALTP
jgi:hypothetical protein